MSCAVFTLLGMLFLATNASNENALRVTFGAAIVMLFVASFLVWRDEHTARLVAEDKVNRTSTSSDGIAEVTANDWDTIAYGFHELLNKGLVAFWFKDAAGVDHWEISDSFTEDREEISSLCKRAGIMLAKSSLILPSGVR